MLMKSTPVGPLSQTHDRTRSASHTENPANEASSGNLRHCFDAPLLESTPLVTWNPAAVPQTPLPEMSMEFDGVKHLSGTDSNPSFGQSLATMSEEVGDDAAIVSAPKKAS